MKGEHKKTEMSNMLNDIKGRKLYAKMKPVLPEVIVT
jgi:hypothetical protein